MVVMIFNVGDRKVSGWAKRIQGNSFLLHGTFLYDVDLDQLERVLQTQSSKMHRKAVKSVRSVVRNVRDLLPFANLGELRNALELEMRDNDASICLSDRELSEIHTLVNSKYRTEQWIYNLSFKPTLIRGFQASCGFVVVNVLLKEGRIEAVDFKGDFLGNKDTAELSALLKGTVWNAETIRQTVSSVNVGDFFSGLTNEDFVANISEMI